MITVSDVKTRQRETCFVSVCTRYLALTGQYLEGSLLLLVTSASGFYRCVELNSVLFASAYASTDNNLSIANRSRVSCAHDTSRASIVTL